MRICRLIFVSVILLMHVLSALGQQNATIRGVVQDENGLPLQFVNIFVEETFASAQTNSKGEFFISLPATLQKATLRFTMVGKKAITVAVKKIDFSKPLLVKMKDLSLTLEEVSVNPLFQQTINSNSSIVFDEEAIERIQAFSLMDILNTLPGKATTAPNIDAPQLITLRGNLDGNYDVNNSLGVAIIMDGINISNDANMQSRSASQFSMGSAALSGANSHTGGDVPFRGIDLRDIPVETIEKIEVIQGIASAQFSEMTDGAILIDRKAAKTPWSFVTNVNGGSTNFSVAKGFNLSRNLGALNLGLNYAISNPDPRDKIKQYKRTSLNMMWSKSFTDRIKNTLSVDVDYRNDQVRMDPDDDTRQLSYARNSGFRLSNRFSWRPETPLIKTVNLAVSYSQSKQNSYKQWLLNSSPKGYAYKDTTGIYEGVVLSGNYIAEEQIIGEPVTASANLNLSTNINWGTVLHVISYGANVNYTNNGGKGIIADPDRPRWINLSGQNARPYSYEYLDPLVNYGFFVSDNFNVAVFDKNLVSNLGFRVDRQNSSWSFQPRLSTVLRWNDKLDFTAAFGIASKSPTMAHRYPAPAFLDIPLILASNSVDALYLLYTQKIEADNSHLKPSKSLQLELGARYAHTWFSSSLNAFMKSNTNGFSSVTNYHSITLPDYDYYYDATLRKILYNANGEYTSYYNYGNYSIENVLNSYSYGVDWMINTRKIDVINTSFNFSTSFILSRENPKRDDLVVISSPLEINGEKIWHLIYPSKSKNRRTSVMSKIGATTHIPPLGFVIMTNFDLFWLRKTSSEFGVNTQSALAYIDQYGQQFSFPADYPNIPVRDLSFANSNQPFIYGSLNLSVAKELKKKFRIAVTAYNVLNIRPEHLIYSVTDAESFTVQTFNSPLSITGGISIKF